MGVKMNSKEVYDQLVFMLAENEAYKKQGLAGAMQAAASHSEGAVTRRERHLKNFEMLCAATTARDLSESFKALGLFCTMRLIDYILHPDDNFSDINATRNFLIATNTVLETFDDIDEAEMAVECIIEEYDYSHVSCVHGMLCEAIDLHVEQAVEFRDYGALQKFAGFEQGLSVIASRMSEASVSGLIEMMVDILDGAFAHPAQTVCAMSLKERLEFTAYTSIPQAFVMSNYMPGSPERVRTGNLPDVGECLRGMIEHLNSFDGAYADNIEKLGAAAKKYGELNPMKSFMSVQGTVVDAVCAELSDSMVQLAGAKPRSRHFN